MSTRRPHPNLPPEGEGTYFCREVAPNPSNHHFNDVGPVEFAYKFGATDVINSREIEPEAIKELSGDGVDMAVDSFGSASVVASAVKALRRGGTAVMVGLVPVGDTAPVDVIDMIRGQKTLVGSYYGSASPHETFTKLVDHYLRGRIDIEGLITRTYTLDQLNDGFDAIERGEDGRGVIVFAS